LGGYNTIKTSQELMKQHIKFSRIESLGRQAVKLTFQSRKTANGFLKNHEVHNQLMITVKVPKMLVQRYAVIYGVPIDVTNDEIMANTECEFPIINIQRLKKKIIGTNNEVKLVDTKLIEFTLESQKLPDYIYVYRERFQVQPRTRKVRQCENCKGYRHSSTVCKGERKCNKCAMKYHEGACDSPLKCLHCKSNSHQTGNVSCPEYIFQQKINDIMANENLTYKEARIQALPNKSRSQENKPLYSQVTANALNTSPSRIQNRATRSGTTVGNTTQDHGNVITQPVNSNIITKETETVPIRRQSRTTNIQNHNSKPKTEFKPSNKKQK